VFSFGAGNSGFNNAESLFFYTGKKKYCEKWFAPG
jgi:hypothetical protein